MNKWTKQNYDFVLALCLPYQVTKVHSKQTEQLDLLERNFQFVGFCPFKWHECLIFGRRRDLKVKWAWMMSGSSQSLLQLHILWVWTVWNETAIESLWVYYRSFCCSRAYLVILYAWKSVLFAAWSIKKSKIQYPRNVMNVMLYGCWI